MMTDALTRKTSPLPEAQRENPSATHATLGFLLSAAVEDLFPEREFYIEHSFIGGYYCHFGVGIKIVEQDLQSLSETLRRYVNDGIALELLELNTQELHLRFTAKGRHDKLEILDRMGGGTIPAARFGDYIDYRFEPMIVDLGRLQSFSLNRYDEGFVLRFPDLLPPYEVRPFKDSPKLYQVIHQRQEWGRALHINNLSQLNRVLDSPGFRETIMVAEGLHEKTVAEIADGISTAHPEMRAIFVSGPSASGKTSFAKRLAIQLKVNGYDTLPLSMDNYFIDQEQMAPQPDGSLDFETLGALDVDRLSDDIMALLEGKEIRRRVYSFKNGRGSDAEDHLALPGAAFLLVEGIHGLNPTFSERLGEDQLQRIYVSAISQMNIDNEHRVSSSDSRLLRRMVRDHQFRGYNAADTVLRWPSVRLGEERHIFAYQEKADFMFNSSLIYEQAVLRLPAENVLKEVRHTSPAYAEAQRLLTFLSFVHPVDPDPVPRNSILREFLGGSAFDY
jgi:uridine kinase